MANNSILGAKVTTDVLDKLRYVDDMVEKAKTEKKMQETIDQVS